jgi:hypothetical protein
MTLTVPGVRGETERLILRVLMSPRRATAVGGRAVYGDAVVIGVVICESLAARGVSVEGPRAIPAVS